MHKGFFKIFISLWKSGCYTTSAFRLLFVVGGFDYVDGVCVVLMHRLGSTWRQRCSTTKSSSKCGILVSNSNLIVDLICIHVDDRHQCVNDKCDLKPCLWVTLWDLGIENSHDWPSYRWIYDKSVQTTSFQYASLSWNVILLCQFVSYYLCVESEIQVYLSVVVGSILFVLTSFSDPRTVSNENFSQ
jgi:hypothetical protein